MTVAVTIANSSLLTMRGVLQRLERASRAVDRFRSMWPSAREVRSAESEPTVPTYIGGAAHFYELEPAIRQQQVLAAASAGKTLMSRWEELGKESTDGWIVRAQRAACLMGPRRSVADLGCGLMKIEAFLEPGSFYIPVDVVRRDSRTIVLDLNRESLPPVNVDGIFGLGLLEYLYDLPRFLAEIVESCNSAVLSYNPVDYFADRNVRTAHAWVNHLTLDEIENLFGQAGFRVEARARVQLTESLWRLAAH